MAELQVDQSNLPRVQEVSQYFSVLEDGALAHNLQEQEIEQHYSSNVQRNQLVQKDIRVAKRLQDEEKQRAQILHEQATRQLEAQDSMYAQRIQEEILHAAEEERRREERDEEIAKRIQEEEELYVRQRTSCRRVDSREKSSTISSTNAHQPSFIEEEELVWHSRAHSPSPSPSDSEAEHYEHRRSFNREYSDSVEQRHQPVQELPLRRHSGQSRNSCTSQSSATGNLQGGWGDVVRLIKNDLSEQGYLSYSSEDEIFEPVYKLERILRRSQQCGKQGTRLSHHSSMRETNSRMWHGDRGGQMDRRRHSEYKDSKCVRSESRLVRHYSNSDYKSGDGHRRVRFQDDQNRDRFYINSRTSLEQRPSENRDLRSYNVRPYHSDVQIDRRTSLGKLNGAHRHEAYGVRNCLSQEIREEDHGRFRERGSWEGGSCRGRAEQRPRANSAREEAESRRYHGELGRRRIGSDRWPGNPEDRSSSEGEDVERERERRRLETRVPRQPQRSLSASFTGRSAGAGPSVNRPSLDLGELRQVLQDEELARRLQAEEEELLRGDLATTTLERSYPEGDFTVAQVAQDEEIAHFIQKQEITSQLQSRQLEDCGSGRGDREMSHVYDNREGCDGQMPRKRLNSEGLISPRDECFPENQPPSPVSLAMQQHPFRNVAEELDPTFQRKGSILAGQSTSDTCQVQTTQQAGSCEEPTFVAPTKRQNDKPGRAKSKEKKENTKSKENCKQQ